MIHTDGQQCDNLVTLNFDLYKITYSLYLVEDLAWWDWHTNQLLSFSA